MILRILFCFLVFQFLISLYLFKKDILSPAVAFNGIFAIAAADLLMMEDFWNVELHVNTLIIMGIGTITFTVTSWLVNKTRCISVRMTTGRVKKRIDYDNIPGNYLNLALIIYVFLIIASMVYVVRKNGLAASFGSLMFNYTQSVDVEEGLQLPVFLSILYMLCSRAGYVWCFLFADYLMNNKKINVRYLLLIIFSCLLGISTGKRGELIALIACLTVCILVALKKYETRKMTYKVYLFIGAVFIVFVASFQTIATVMGRDSDLFSPVEYFSIYLGAPILNLDTSILKAGFRHPTFLSETFHSLYMSIGENLNISRFIYMSDRIFWSSVNGKRVGNVATVFYDFYHDGGIWGVIILTAIMATISQLLYKRIKRQKYRNRMFSTIVYSYVYWLVVRSFFANSFFDWFTLSTIYSLLLWWLYSIIAYKIGKNRKIMS